MPGLYILLHVPALAPRAEVLTPPPLEAGGSPAPLCHPVLRMALVSPPKASRANSMHVIRGVAPAPQRKGGTARGGAVASTDKPSRLDCLVAKRCD